MSPEGRFGLAAAAILAIAAPPLLAYNISPSATFLNQALAFVGWAVLLVMLFAVLPRSAPTAVQKSDKGGPALVLALALLIVAAITSLTSGATTPALMLSTVTAMLAAVLCTGAGIATTRRGLEKPLFGAICIALVVCGALSTLVAIVQVFIPQWADGDFIAPSSVVGRATGNLRQPNHLCSLMMWGLVALVWLSESGWLKRPVAWVLGLCFLFTLVLTASRTAWPDLVVLLLWALLDKRLARSTRVAMAAACAAYVALWLGMSEWAKASHHLFYGAERLATQTDISSSRYGIWLNTLSLIQAHPWFGVGWGDFNFAWSLTPFPGRPTAFFDHTHNIVLQFLVELGLPLGIVVTLLLGYAVWRVLRVPGETEGERRGALRAGSIMVAMIAIHSLLEYPLWYAYFLLPTAFLLGLGLGVPRDTGASTTTEPHPDRSRPWLLGASVCMLLVSLAAVRDYYRVVVIFAPDDDSISLDQRIEDGRRSWFFAHHANYAAATVAAKPSTAMASFADASHYLLDTRLMMAWAKALDELGQVDKARYIAARLREFRNEDSKPFFEPCDEPEAGKDGLPFQCSPPEKAYSYRDFR